MNTNFEKYYLYITVFITGAVILILEILGTRIVAPYYGTTIYVWSSLIGITLVSLALGYFFGGYAADKFPASNMLYLIIAVAALFVLVIPLTANFALIKTSSLGIKYGALTSAGILFTVPLLLLGAVAPYAIKLKTREVGELGTTSGSLYSIATIGSFIGAIATGFYFLPAIGINSVIYLSSGILFGLAFVWFIFQRKNPRMMLIAAVLALVAVTFVMFVVFSARQTELGESTKIIYETESPYARLKVIDESGEDYSVRYLFVNGATHTRFDLLNSEFTFPYLKLFEKAVRYSDAKDILVIGLGGGGIDKILQGYEVEIDNVEIDERVIEIAREYFGFKGKVVLDDGRHYIRNSEKKYDVVYLDVYGGYSIYPYLFSKEALGEIKSILSDGGLVVINAMGYESHLSTEDKLILSIYRTLKEVFANVQVKSTGYDLASFVFYATDSDFTIKDSQFVSIDMAKAEKGLEKAVIVTDDFNPIDFFASEAAAEWADFDIKMFKHLLL